MTGLARGGSDSGSLGWNSTRRSPPAKRRSSAAAAGRSITNGVEGNACAVQSCVAGGAEDARGALAAPRRTERVVS